MIYGNPPTPVGRFEPAWDEFMHYLYLPVCMPGEEGIRLPPNLEFARALIDQVRYVEQFNTDLSTSYIYLTTRRGWATPGNPLNRPGWHSDGFGSNDVNYIWADRWPTRFAIGEFVGISEDHVESAKQFDRIAASGMVEVVDGDPFEVYRLDPSVIHATPLIDPPGGPRSFLKLSFSPSRYNLRGNSHNYLFNYDWMMWDREQLRNDPSWAGGDVGPQGGSTHG